MSSPSSPLPFLPPVSASELRHRLRTPLNHVIGYAEILIEEHPGPRFTPRLDRILGEANAMLESVQQVEGTNQTTVNAGTLAALRDRLDPGAGRIQQIVVELQQLMPPAASEDLRRIASAAGSLRDALVIGGTGDFGAPPEPGEARPEAATEPGRILVVDDFEMNRDMLRRQLTRQQHEVMTAPDGPTALAMLRERHFDIMLLDLMMPGMNGFEVLEAVKADPAISGVAVILVSALDEMDSVVRSIEAGAEDYLFKPVNPTLLRARIKSTLERLRAAELVRRKQRLESIGLLAAGIAHDFNNLLTGILGYAQLLHQVLAEPKDRDMAEAILRNGERAAELTRQLLAYSGKAMFRMQTVNLPSLICESEGLIHASLPKQVRLQLQLGDAPPIMADVTQVRQILLNLTLNAAEAIGPGAPGSVTIETGTEEVAPGTQFDVMADDFKPGPYAWFEVRDTGGGMDAATVSKMFEPFFTTKFLGRGLGLAAVAGIVRSHRGLLRVTSAPEQGSALRLYFPVAAARERKEPDEKVPAAGPLILVVDDESVVRQIVKVALERAGCGVVLAETAEEAIKTLRQLGDRIGVVLLDWKASQDDGGEVLARLRDQRPGLKVIVSGGYTQSEAAERFRDVPITGYLQKPYRMSELVALLETVSAGKDFVAKQM